MTTGRPKIDLAAVRDRHPQHFGRAGLARFAGPGLAAGGLALLIYGMGELGFFNGNFLAGIVRLGEVIGLMLPPDPGTWAHTRLIVMALFETIAIALLGTLAAAVLAMPLALLAARNVTTMRILRILSRRSLDTIRSVEGLGPFAGALAIMTSDIGSLGKLFSEAIEASDRKPVEGIVSAGGGRILGVRFGILPEVFPVLASQVLYFFESNTRSASIIGVVGAGGIGLYLAEGIRTLELQQVSFIILLILAAVAAIDFVSSQLRFAIIGPRMRTTS